MRAVRLSWEPVDLDGVLAAGCRVEPPTMCLRGDGEALLYAGCVASIQAEPEAGKTWAAARVVVERLQAGERVLYVDMEDSAANILARLQSLGASSDQLLDGLVYVAPATPLSEAAFVELEQHLDGVTLAVIDGVTEALAGSGFDLNSNVDYARWLGMLANPLKVRGIAVLLLDHVTKDREGRGRYAIGAQHKLAGVDLAYTMKVVRPFGRGRDGLVKLIVAKDRRGYVRGLADDGGHVADVCLTSRLDGGVTVDLSAPGEGTTATTGRPIALMAQVSRAVEGEPGIGKRALRLAVQGSNEPKELAIELLVGEGFVEQRREGQAVRHYNVRPFPPVEGDCADPPQACRESSGTAAWPDGADVPPSYREAQGTGTVSGRTITVPSSVLSFGDHLRLSRDAIGVAA